MKVTYHMNNHSFVSIEGLYMRKDDLQAGTCDKKGPLLFTTDYLCELEQFSVIPRYLFPTYETGGLSMALMPRHCPSTFHGVSGPSFWIVLRPREHAVENMSNRYILWLSTN